MSRLLRDVQKSIHGRRATLSVCMIAKDEEATLGRALESVSPLGAQMIVVDTGSADRTREIAVAAGAEVHEFPWQDDFAQARNASLSHATGDWVLVLDADEWLDDGGQAAVSQLIHGPRTFYAPQLIEAGAEHLRAPTITARLFPRAGTRYVGVVHERPVNEQVPQEIAGAFAIFHDGYSSTRPKDRNKRERNLALLRKAIAAEPENLHYLEYLAGELLLHDIESVEGREILEKRLPRPLSRHATDLLSRLYMQEARFDDAEAVLRESLESTTTPRAVLSMLAAIAMSRQDSEHALGLSEQALSLPHDPVGNIRAIEQELRLTRWTALLYLGRIEEAKAARRDGMMSGISPEVFASIASQARGR